MVNTPQDLYLERVYMKDQAADLLRDLIVSGRIAPGSKLTERDVCKLLNISRMPARDALMALEHQGLLISKPAGRYVIELGEEEVRHFYNLRLALEKLAVEFAIHNSSDTNLALLEAKVEEMRQAIADGDSSRYARSDFAMHQLIWQQSGNPYLIEVLNSMIGPIFLFISSQAGIVEDWQASLRLHEHLVETIASKDVVAAVKSMEDHVLHSLDLALQAFKH